ncbi:MAG: hypothetical protein ABIP53_00125 [Candidatus Limnocylindrales bacterium]
MIVAAACGAQATPPGTSPGVAAPPRATAATTSTTLPAPTTAASLRGGPATTSEPSPTPLNTLAPSPDLSAAEIYDPAAGTFSSNGSMGDARQGAVAARRHDGRVLIAGGIGIGTDELIYLTSAVLYQP